MAKDDRRTISDVGELEFIRNIREMMPKEGGDIIRSVGDDCLVVQCPGDYFFLFTVDTFVDSVHFNHEYFSFEQIGKRCMSASVSDIAAMSGLPLYSLLSLSMPGEMLYKDSHAIFKGLAETGKRYGCPLAGGETTSTPGPLVITLTIVGKAEKSRVIYRSGARLGDSIYVTGNIGDAMAGLLAFEKKEKGFESLKSKFISPEARVDLSRSLSEKFRISSMIDLSDGIASDLGHICEESGCGAVIDENLIPLSPEMRELVSRYGKDLVHFALTSGEDYELLFTSSDPEIPAKGMVLHCPITRIGKITEARREMFLINKTGSREKIQVKGYEHFKS